MLEEVKLVILCLYIEVRAVNIHRASRARTERRIGKNDVYQCLRFFLQRVLTSNRTSVNADAVQIKVHRCKRNNERRVVNTVQSLIVQEIKLTLVL